MNPAPVPCGGPGCTTLVVPPRKFCSHSCVARGRRRDAKGKLLNTTGRPRVERVELGRNVYRRVAGDIDREEIEARYQAALAEVRMRRLTQMAGANPR